MLYNLDKHDVLMWESTRSEDAMLISPKLIPLINYRWDAEYDKQIGDWRDPDPSEPMTIQNKWGDTLSVEGDELKQQLRNVATIYRNTEGSSESEKLRAIARTQELLMVDAIAEVGRLREAEPEEFEVGLLLQIDQRYLDEWGLGEFGLTRLEVELELADRGFIALTPSIVIKEDGFFLLQPGSVEEEGGDFGNFYNEFVEREFAVDK